MAKSKYDPETFPTLAEGWARDGLTEVQIAHNLGISKSTLESYKVKYPDFLDSLKRGKGPVDFEVENALLKRALGYTYDEIHVETRTEPRTVGKGEKAKVVIKNFKVNKVVTKEVVPDVVACIFWLKNRRPLQWREKVEDNNNGIGDYPELLKEFSKLIREGDLSE